MWIKGKTLWPYLGLIRLMIKLHGYTTAPISIGCTYQASGLITVKLNAFPIITSTRGQWTYHDVERRRHHSRGLCGQIISECRLIAHHFCGCPFTDILILRGHQCDQQVCQYQSSKHCRDKYAECISWMMVQRGSITGRMHNNSTMHEQSSDRPLLKSHLIRQTLGTYKWMSTTNRPAENLILHHRCLLWRSSKCRRKCPRYKLRT